MKVSAILQSIEEKEQLAGALKAVARHLTPEEKWNPQIKELVPMGTTCEGMFTVADLMNRAATEIGGEAVMLKQRLNDVDIDW